MYWNISIKGKQSIFYMCMWKEGHLEPLFYSYCLCHTVFFCTWDPPCKTHVIQMSSSVLSLYLYLTKETIQHFLGSQWQREYLNRLLCSTWRLTTLPCSCLFLCLSVYSLLPRGESAYSSGGHSSGQSLRDVCDGSEEGQYEVHSAACHINAPELCLPLSAPPYVTHTPRLLSLCHLTACVCVCVLFSLHLQALGGRWPDSAGPSGELRAPWGLIDSACHHHHAPLRRVWRPTGLADPAQEPFTAEPVGGEKWETQL